MWSYDSTPARTRKTSHKNCRKRSKENVNGGVCRNSEWSCAIRIRYTGSLSSKLRGTYWQSSYLASFTSASSLREKQARPPHMANAPSASAATTGTRRD